MAEALQKAGTQLSFADHAGDFLPTAANDLEQGTPTNVQLQYTGVVDGAFVNSTKADFGVNRAAQFSVMSVIEWGSAPVAGVTVNYWWAPSPDSVNANGNPGGVDGVDGAYVGYGAAAVDADEARGQLLYIGSLVATADSGIQVAYIGTFSPPERFGCLIIKNASGVTFFTDDVEMHTVVTPIIDDVS